MYLATLFVALDLEPEVTPFDRARLLRSLRDRLKQNFGSRITVRTDDDAAIMVAFFDDNYERLKIRLAAVIEKVDHAGEARISDTQSQTFAWFEGRFQETRDELAVLDCELDFSDLASSFTSRAPSQKNTSIVYKHDDDEFSEFGSRTGRRNMRIPARK